MATALQNFEDETNKIDSTENDNIDNQTQMEAEVYDNAKMKTSSSLQLILASIAQERNKEFQPQQLISEEGR